MYIIVYSTDWGGVRRRWRTCAWLARRKTPSTPNWRNAATLRCLTPLAAYIHGKLWSQHVSAEILELAIPPPVPLCTKFSAGMKNCWAFHISPGNIRTWCTRHSHIYTFTAEIRNTRNPTPSSTRVSVRGNLRWGIAFRLVIWVVTRMVLII